MTRTRGWIRAAGIAAAAAMTLLLGLLPAGSTGANAGGGSTSTSARTAPASGVLFGAYVNDRAGLSQLGTVQQLESMLGRKLAIVNKYHPFSSTSFGYERDVLAGGRVPMVSWRGTDEAPDANRAAKIARGDFDAAIARTADALAALRGRVLVRWNWEMDQDPGDRQFIGSPSEFIAAWRRIVGIFRDRGAANVEFVWAPRAGSFSKGEGQAYFPGDAWVDWIGGSAVPVSNYEAFGSLFADFYAWASARSKPILIWTGVRERSGDPLWKADWFDGAHRVIAGRMPLVRAFVYYHAKTPLGHAYWADTTARAFAAFDRMGDDPWFRAVPGGSDTPTPSPSPSPSPSGDPGPPPGAVLFADGFEGGDLSAWTDGGGGLAVQGAVVQEGAWAARQTATGGGAATWARKLLETSQPALRIDVRFRIVTPGTTVGLVKFLVPPSSTPLTLSLRGDGRLVTWTAADGSVVSATGAGPGAWHHLRVELATGASPRSLVVLDGATVADLSGAVTVGSSPLGGIQLGNSSSGRTYDIAFDEVVVSTPS
jgi:hypothetical protein